MPTCQGKTKDGRPCSRTVKGHRPYCWQHPPDEPVKLLTDADGKPRPEVYELLARATPEEKADIVLKLIGEHPKGKLELPRRDEMQIELPKISLEDLLSGKLDLDKRLDLQEMMSVPTKVEDLIKATRRPGPEGGVDLHEVDLSTETLKVKKEEANLETCPWWSMKYQRPNFHGANLTGADLRDANLQGARLAGANLQGAYLGKANLRDAYLADANLEDTELYGANLQDAVLAFVNLSRATVGRTNLQRANLILANLREADLIDANLQSAILGSAQFQNATLIDVDLTIPSPIKGY